MLAWFISHQKLILTKDTSDGCFPYQHQPFHPSMRPQTKKRYVHLYHSCPPTTEMNLLLSVFKFTPHVQPIIEASFITFGSLNLLTGKWWHGGKYLGWLSLRNRQPLRCEVQKPSPLAAFIGHGASHKAGGVFVLSYCPNEHVGLQIQALRYIMCWFSPIIATLLGATPEFRQICMNSRANEGNTFKLVPVQRSDPELSFKRLDQLSNEQKWPSKNLILLCLQSYKWHWPWLALKREIQMAIKEHCCRCCNPLKNIVNILYHGYATPVRERAPVPIQWLCWDQRNSWERQNDRKRGKKEWGEPKKLNYSTVHFEVH